MQKRWKCPHCKNDGWSKDGAMPPHDTKNGVSCAPSGQMSERMLKDKHVNHIVARVSGVKKEDTKIQAAEKALATMRLAGFSSRDIKKAEDMIARARARGVT